MYNGVSKGGTTGSETIATGTDVIVMMPRVQGVTGVADILAFRARSQGQKEAVVCGEQRITYNQLHGRAKAIAHQLKALGLKPGEKVGIYLPNGVEFIASFYGAIGFGCTVVPINPLLKSDEVAHILADSDCRVLIAHEMLLQYTKVALENTTQLIAVLVVPTLLTGVAIMPKLPVKTIELDPGKTVEVFDWTPVNDVLTDVAAIVYTSGTTGKPKGAMLTHYNLLSVFPARLDLFDIGEDDRCLCVVPLCHIYGMTVLMIGTIARAGTLIVLPRFDAAGALRLIEREAVTILPAVPTMYQFMLSELAKNNYDLSSLRLCFSGAAPLTAEVRALVESFFGVPMIEGYALTETSCVATINPLKGTRKLGSVGITIPGVQVAIFNEAGQPLPAGEGNIGEIAVSGPNIMLGYYKQPEASAEVLKNGWFFTGDLGYADEEGYIFIVGRKKELILRGGANVYPREVEDVIMTLPGIREVAVIGVPDERMGERVKAIVATANPAITEDVVKEHCTQHLADYKVPRLVEFTDALPRNSTGKVLKRLLS
jgi:long-chain acyl-CoA synthetase